MLNFGLVYWKIRDYFIFGLMGLLAALCILGMITFVRNLHNNYWWRWIYLLGGVYVLFDLFAIAAGLEFWNGGFLRWMFDVKSSYWNIVWMFLNCSAVFPLYGV